MTCKIITIVGARPQFIKAAAVSREILKHPGILEEIMIHTGQHYDPNMSQVFFDELEIPAPKYNLEISGGSHGAMTARMLEGIEQILLTEKPNWVLIYGDTNSTLAGALAAAKLHIPVAHVEAGLRSFNMRMPEEINRILSDRVSTLLLCPTMTAVENLAREGITQGVHNVGDVMYDVALYYRDRARNTSQILDTLALSEKGFALATCHRAENTDSPERLNEILSALAAITAELPVVLPLHPRTRKLISDHQLEHLLQKLTIVPPLAFLDMVALEQAAKVILTDSGGVQKEAFFYQVPCITMRDETEWVETVALGWNHIVGASQTRILDAFSQLSDGQQDDLSTPYGNGSASRVIIEHLMKEA
ncbi:MULTISPECIES: non-hydrolyzing UDP-N-acetylglucosamine 2-epimerase [Pseudomonas]|nr:MULTISPECIES: UDP-N-acetylglucosamine 2-epimerase (non-hydrolyzing) [Pseudomonas]MBP5100581.1 UDP-N-acetylglucosamine 2-epimerase (non-hydrolyzing) [Pseudomonas protegens]MBP5115713.1 UDP-N-acetylglucosamine 2-epimerase (non-hydrolyzing) [Pseudomonas protegens]MBP5127068.1 UDP-N-acetylglucosamine 2-epimerase (non-hydrolyzing) [Pseudomonas protegens]QTU04927.1 UDP-N-acetylglucosamine 2-epimerase (non-hydrolyzing) [Pseudomonas protegens]QTU11237.1 UDP-N-acetylglucosamine 2-epimerase (non-hydr